MESFLTAMTAAFHGWEDPSICKNVLHSSIVNIHLSEFDSAVAIAIKVFKTGFANVYFQQGQFDRQIPRDAAEECIQVYLLSLPWFSAALVRIFEVVHSKMHPEFIAPPNVVRVLEVDDLYRLLEVAAASATPGRWSVLEGKPWSGFSGGHHHNWLPRLVDQTVAQSPNPSHDTPMLAHIIADRNMTINRVYNCFNLLRQSFHRVESQGVLRDLVFPNPDPVLTVDSLIAEVLRKITQYLSDILEHQIAIGGELLVPLGEYEDVREALVTILHPLPLQLRPISGFRIDECKMELEGILLRCFELASPDPHHVELKLFTTIDIFSSGGVPFRDWLPVVTINRDFCT